MKAELKAKIVKEAKDLAIKDGRFVVSSDAKVNAAPDVYWVQAWIAIDQLDFQESPDKVKK